MITEDHKTASTFSINGKYLTSFTDDKEIINPMIMEDDHFNEKLIYGNLTGKINIQKLPYLNEPNTISGIDKSSAIPLAVTPDRRVLIYYNNGI